MTASRPHGQPPLGTREEAEAEALAAQVMELLKPVLQEMDRKLDTLITKMDDLLAALARWDADSIDALLARLDAGPGAVPHESAPGQDGASRK
jgi:hypothetical protein